MIVSYINKSLNELDLSRSPKDRILKMLHTIKNDPSLMNNFINSHSDCFVTEQEYIAINQENSNTFWTDEIDISEVSNLEGQEEFYTGHSELDERTESDTYLGDDFDFTEEIKISNATNETINQNKDTFWGDEIDLQQPASDST